MTNLKRVSLLIFLFAISSCSSNNLRETPAPLPQIIEPRPDFILETAPAETQVLPISLFEARSSEPGGLPADQWENLDGYNSSVCLKTETGGLAQIGDDFSDNSTMIPRVTMMVDDVETKAIGVNGILLQRINVGDADGNILMWGVEPKLICGYFVLDPGVHEVLFRFRQTSGDVLEYRWQFGLISDENASSVSTISVSRVLPTPTLQPPIQLPSAPANATLIPTLTHTEQPTTPTPTHTVSPTVTKTPVAIPTVPDMEVTQQVLWLFETNNGCQLPCWWGITPGQTEWQTAKEFLSRIDPIHREVPLASGFTYYGVEIPLPAEAFFLDEIELGILVRNGVVEEITTSVSNLTPPPKNLAHFALSSILTNYGTPSEVWLFTYPAPYEQDDLPFFVVLFYADQGIVALYNVNGERQGEMVQGCLQQEQVRFLSLWYPALELTFEEAIRGTSALERDYLSLEEATEMSVTTFYETFKNPENTTCLKTPADLWRQLGTIDK